ncbi:MAG: protein kinase, partial [Candidatus Krumholzibacteriia bacterium]
DCEGAYYLLGRSLFAAGRFQEVIDLVDAAVHASGDDYNIYVPIINALGALGKDDALRNMTQRRVLALEKHIAQVPDDARARLHLALGFVICKRPDDAAREVQFAIALRPNDANQLYNVACVYCNMNNKAEALAALKRAWENGFRDAVWARRDPDLAILHGDPDFDRLYPERAPA